MDAIGQENYVRIKCLLLPRAASVLRSVFRKTWKKAKKERWCGTEEQGQIFITGIGKHTIASNKRKVLIAMGNEELWSLSLLCQVLKKTDFGRSNNLTRQEKEKIQVLIDESLKIKSCNGQILKKSQFNSIWNRVENVLVSFGHSPIELQVLKTSKLTENLDFELKLDVRDMLDPNLFIQLVDSIYKANSFDMALDTYTKILAIPNLPSKDSAIIYLYRSKELLQNSYFLGAKDDIKKAIQLCPSWVLAYYHLAKVYKACGKKHKAELYLEVADILANYEFTTSPNTTAGRENRVKDFDYLEEKLKNFKPFPSNKIVKSMCLLQFSRGRYRITGFAVEYDEMDELIRSRAQQRSQATIREITDEEIESDRLPRALND